jgi:hypothetical protein
VDGFCDIPDTIVPVRTDHPVLVVDAFHGCPFGRFGTAIPGQRSPDPRARGSPGAGDTGPYRLGIDVRQLGV